LRQSSSIESNTSSSSSSSSSSNDQKQMLDLLFLYARMGDLSKLEIILGPNPHLIAQSTSSKRNLLMEAVRHNQINITSHILSTYYSPSSPSFNNVLNINMISKRGFSALHLAVNGGFFEVAKLLVENGADYSQLTHKGDDVRTLAVKARYRGENEMKEAMIQWLENLFGEDGVGEEFGDNHPSNSLSTMSTESNQSNQSSNLSIEEGKDSEIGEYGELVPFSPPLPTVPLERMSSRDAQDSADVDLEAMKQWLRLNKLVGCEDKLIENGIASLDALQYITEDDLKEIGLLLGHKRLLLGLLPTLTPYLESLKVNERISSGNTHPTTSLTTNSNESTFSDDFPIDNEEEEEDEDEAKMKISEGEVNEESKQRTKMKKKKRGGQSSKSSITHIRWEQLNFERENGSYLDDDLMKNIEHGINNTPSNIKLKIVGEGSFGTVFKAKWRGMKVAVKELKLSTPTSAHLSEEEEAYVKDLYREARVLSGVCHHENILPFIGVVLSPHHAIVTQFMDNGSVEDFLINRSSPSFCHSVPITSILRMALESAKGVGHLHMEGVIHRDLASRNLLLDDQMRVKVADFGFARIKKNQWESKVMTKTEVGPVKWTSPESMRSKSYSEKSDVFSFGVVLWEFLSRSPPWPGMDPLEVVYQVFLGERMVLNQDKMEEFQIPEGVVDLMNWCWRQDYDERPAMREVVEELEDLCHRILHPQDVPEDEEEEEDEIIDEEIGEEEESEINNNEEEEEEGNEFIVNDEEYDDPQSMLVSQDLISDNEDDNQEHQSNDEIVDPIYENPFQEETVMRGGDLGMNNDVDHLPEGDTGPLYCTISIDEKKLKS